MVTRRRVVVDFTGTTSRAKQQFKDECDINHIMSRYAKSGLLTHVSRYQGQYADVSHGMDYRAALDAVHAADEMFYSLPSSLRSRFRNDAGVFLAFAATATPEQLMELGLLPASEQVLLLRKQKTDAAAAAAAVAAAAEARSDKPASKSGKSGKSEGASE